MPAAALIVVTRIGDTASQAIAAASRSNVVLQTVTAPGVLAAMAAGVQTATTDLIAFTDDDACPHEDWIERLLTHFADPRVGGVGGRDVIPHLQGPLTPRVGTLSSWGRLTGNHHLGVGGAREVDVLKGVNMAFRRSALALPDGLAGSGAQAHFEVATCLHARNAGWRLIYDSEVLVDHHMAERFDADRRLRPAGSAVSNATQNYVYGLLSMRRDLLIRRTLYGLLVGSSDSPGIGRAMVALVGGEGEVLRRLGPSTWGQLRATWWVLHGRQLEMRPVGGVSS
jgi:cellulose synthase/poly-beta-1,6-N-acetylglucosamine synthase-like glycosyltransferase